MIDRRFGINPVRVLTRYALALGVGTLMTLAPVGKAGSADADAKVVAALDTEYQAAVKGNNAATMGRILAEDFVLVTGLEAGRWLLVFKIANYAIANAQAAV